MLGKTLRRFMTNCCELHWLHYRGLDRGLPESERLNVTSCHTLEATSKDLLSRLFWMSELQLERMTSYYTGTVTRSNPASTWETKPLYCYHPSTLHGTQSITNRKWKKRSPGARANWLVDLNKFDQLTSPPLLAWSWQNFLCDTNGQFGFV